MGEQKKQSFFLKWLILQQQTLEFWWLTSSDMENVCLLPRPDHRIFNKGTGHHVVGDEKTSVTMVLNKNLWLEINANTSSNERMPARHRSLWRDWLCSLQFVSVLYSSHKYPQLNNGYGRFFATYNMVSCSLFGSQVILGPEKFCVRENFGSGQILVPKKSASRKMWFAKN